MSASVPQKSGWYWYREDGLNLNRPMPAWVFGSEVCLYTELCAVHEPATFCRTRKVRDCPGDWLGVVEGPK